MANIKPRLGVNNIDLSEILSDINNLPPAGTEDISAELDAQTTAVEELLKIAKKKVAEQNGEGQYVWKKSKVNIEEISESKTSQRIFYAWGKTSNTSTFDIYYSDEYQTNIDGSFTLVNPTTETVKLSVLKDSAAKYSGKYMITTAASEGKEGSLITGKYLLRIDTWSSTVSSYNNKNYLSGSYTLITANVTESDVSYVVSFDDTMYPNGVELDGYWYELIGGLGLSAIGVTECSYVEFTFSEKTYLDTKIDHGLNKIPKFVYLFRDDVPSTHYAMYWVIGANIHGHMDHFGEYRYNSTFNDVSFYNFNDVRYVYGSKNNIFYEAGVTYKLFVMA